MNDDWEFSYKGDKGGCLGCLGILLAIALIISVIHWIIESDARRHCIVKQLSAGKVLKEWHTTGLVRYPGWGSDQKRFIDHETGKEVTIVGDSIVEEAENWK